MQSYILVFFLLAGFCTRIYGDEGSTNDEDLDCPCDLNDKTCITSVLMQYSDASAVHSSFYGPDQSDKYLVDLNTCNITVVYIDSVINYPGATLYKFCKDLKRNMFIISVHYPTYQVIADKCAFIYYRLNQESVTRWDKLNATYAEMFVTARIPIKDSVLQTQDTSYNTYAKELDPVFFMGPNLTNSPDPNVSGSIAYLMSHMDAGIRETIASERERMFWSFIQRNYADFGVPISKDTFVPELVIPGDHN